MSQKQIDLRVANLDCEHDAAAIERGLNGFNGLGTLKVYPKSAKVSLTYDPVTTDAESLKKELDSLGFPPKEGLTMPEQPKPWRNPKVLTSVASGVLLLVGWLLSLAGVPEIEHGEKEGVLLQEGIYGRIRHPRYMEFLLGEMSAVELRAAPALDDLPDQRIGWNAGRGRASNA